MATEVTPVTATTPAAEPVTPATPATEVPKAEAETPAQQPSAPTPSPASAPQETDYEAAYKGLQRTVNRLHLSNEELRRQNAEMTAAMSEVRETQRLLARQSLGEEEVKALEARQKQASERAAAIQAAQAAQSFIEAQTALFLDTLKAAGIDPQDKDIDWGRDARDVQEWRERVGPSVAKKLTATIAKRIADAEEGVRTRTRTEIRAEAEALAARQLKEAGVDKVDTGKGSAPTQKLAIEMTEEEFAAESERRRQERERRRMQSLR